MTKAMLIINPSSGQEKGLKFEEEAVTALKKQHEEVTVKYTEGEGDATRFAEEASFGKYDALVAMGGDGTINESINGLAEKDHKPVFGFVPLGTVNDFARALGIPMDEKKAIGVLETSNTRSVDIGKIAGERYFMNVLAVGAIAEAVYQVSPEQKSKFGPLAYLIEGAQAIREETPFDLSIDYDGKKWEGKAYLVLVALTNSVGGIETFAREAEVNDGAFHVFILKEFSLPKVVQLIPDLFRGELKSNEQVEYFTATDMKVDTSLNLVVNIDGDEGMKLPFEARLLHNELNVYVPEE
ncbi:sphingosine kinase [Salimicrobium jeotgali]|uniref:Diacylglycerol kinase n=1 Tax=Salimicrobium jeotgali TaxID=1230341 RepID=K2GNL0_9BACI|nr:diacylglycerol kinase family protein [Salimicrobium jeotgali]AKG03500.1 sphingosine kinase [Salimicrobium jeotgali]EKE31984.1 diacylglycerol kinase [Salimicrobium jeotgali]MBM7695950.1 YegS/Rv2252/BmrU family lipid kinase [Salimicrobium jeotgali]